MSGSEPEAGSVRRVEATHVAILGIAAQPIAVVRDRRRGFCGGRRWRRGRPCGRCVGRRRASMMTRVNVMIGMRRGRRAFGRICDGGARERNRESEAGRRVHCPLRSAHYPVASRGGRRRRSKGEGRRVRPLRQPPPRRQGVGGDALTTNLHRLATLLLKSVEADHHVGRLDDRVGLLALLQLQLVDRFIGDRRGDRHAAT